MKKSILILTLTCISFVFSASAQRLGSTYTPNGTYVPGYLATYDLTPATYASNMAYVASSFPSATMIRVATAAYNCHGYAWHMSNTARPWINMIWINPPYQQRYMPTADGGDNSYSASTEAVGRKVWYSQGDHSAVVIAKNLSGFVYRSKWGSCPLMVHAKTYCPYTTTNIKYYYNSQYLGENVDCNIEKTVDASLFKWEMNFSDANIDGFNIVKVDENKNQKSVNDKIIPRKSYDEINKDGEAYTFPVSSTDKDKYYLQIVRKGGATELVEFNNPSKN